MWLVMRAPFPAMVSFETCTTISCPSRRRSEIDASVRRLRGRNAYDTPVAQDEFPLTTMADDLARMRQEIATGRGFFVFRGLDKDRYSDNELGLVFRGFGAHFGHELTQSAFGDRLGDIRDISDILVDRSKRRGYQSGGFQTAHTDPSGEVGIVAMLSLNMAMSGGESLIATRGTPRCLTRTETRTKPDTSLSIETILLLSLLPTNPFFETFLF